MKIEEVAGAGVWAELLRQIELIKPKQAGKSTPNATVKQREKPKHSALDRATGRLKSAVARLKPKSPVKPVVMARPGKPDGV